MTDREPLTEEQRRLIEGDWVSAMKIANRFKGRYGDMCDWHGAAATGACEAAQTFDPGRKVRFKTHLCRRVVGACLDLMRANEAKGFRRKWRQPTPGDAPTVQSLNALEAYSDRRGWAWAWAEPTDPHSAEAVELAEAEDEFHALVRGLSAKEKAIVTDVYLYGRTLKESGERLGFSESRASQLHTAAIERLRYKLRVPA